MIRYHLLDRSFYRFSKLVLKYHSLYTLFTPLFSTRRIPRMLMILLRIIRISDRNQAAHVVVFRNSKSLDDAGSIQATEIHSAYIRARERLYPNPCFEPASRTAA